MTILEYCNILIRMKNPPGGKKLEFMASALKGMAHPARIRILMLLGCSARLSVSRIQAETGLTQSMTSQHLLAMKSAGLLASEKERNKVFYFINNKDVMKVISCMNNCAERRMT